MESGRSRRKIQILRLDRFNAAFGAIRAGPCIGAFNSGFINSSGQSGDLVVNTPAIRAPEFMSAPVLSATTRHWQYLSDPAKASGISHRRDFTL